MIAKHATTVVKYLWPIFLGTGLLIRLVVYLQQRSLFLDEANLARNIAERSFAGFFVPLDHQQYAPPFFLVLEKINWFLAGPSELALRFWPLVMGGAALYFFYRVLRRSAGTGVPALFIFYLFAFSQVYVRYSSELKQYSTDMAVTGGLIWLAGIRPPVNRSGILTWMLAGSIAVWISMPSVFVLAGIGIYFALRFFYRQRRLSLFGLVLMGGSWILQFGLYYYLVLRLDLQKTALLDYHRVYFWPLWPNAYEDWQQLWHLTESFLSTLIGHTVPAVLLGSAGLAFGVYHLWKKDKERLLLLGLPVVLCVFASGLARYSLIERLTLFMMPLLGLLLAVGLGELWERGSKVARIVLLTGFLLVLPLRKALEYLVYPLQYEEMSDLLIALEDEKGPDDLIWVDHQASPAYRWYTQYDPPSGMTGSMDQNPLHGDWSGLAVEDIRGLPELPKQVWLVFSHLVSAPGLSEMRKDLESMRDDYGAPVSSLYFPGVAAYKFVR